MTEHDSSTTKTPTRQTLINRAKKADALFVGEARIDEAYRRLEARESFWRQVSSWVEIKPHPASLMMPLMSREAFGALVERVREHGFREAVMLTVGGPLSCEVVEGRHRLAVAWALDMHLRSTGASSSDLTSKVGLPYVSMNVGISSEAVRQYVWDKNGMRRHLTKAQDALLVCEMFLPLAKANAEIRRKEGNAKGGKSALSGGSTSEDTKSNLSAAEEASQMSGGLVSRASIERIRIVTEKGTPVTYARVWSGQTVSVLSAHKEALAEIAEREEAARAAAAIAAADATAEEDEEAPAPPSRGPRVPGVTKRLVKAAEELHEALETLRHGMRPLADPDDQREVLISIQNMVTEWFDLLDQDDDPTRVPYTPGDDQAF